MIDVCKGSYLDVFVLILISIHQIQPPNRFGFGTGSESEPQAAVMVRSHAVLSHLEVITVNHFDSTLSTCADQCVKHYGFHAALQDPASNRQSLLQFITHLPDGRDIIASALQEGVLFTADKRTNSLIVSAPASNMPLLESLIKALDTANPRLAELRV